MKIRKNDDVIILSGKEKGKSGKVLSINPKTLRIKVAGVHMIQKHVKPSQSNPDGGIQKTEGTIHISNVAFKTSGKNGGATRIGYKVNDNGKKTRYAKSTGKAV